MGGAAEHHEVDLHGENEPAVEVLAHDQPGQHPEDGEEDVLPKDVGGELPVIEAQHLEGGQLPEPLGEVDAGQVEEDHEGKGTRRDDDQQHGSVHHRHALLVDLLAVGDVGHRRHPGQGDHRRRNGVGGVVGAADQPGVPLRGRPVEGGIAVGGEVDVVVDVVLRNAGDGGGDGPVAGEGDGVAHREGEKLGELFGDDHPAVGEGDRVVGGAVPEDQQVTEVLISGGGHLVDLHLPPTCGGGDGGEPGGEGLRSGGGEGGVHLLGLGLGDVVGEHHLEGVPGELPVLDVGDGQQGVPEAEAGDDEGGAAADAGHRHAEAALVAEEVAEGDLLEEGEPPPQGTDPLQQHPFARLGGPGAHELGGDGGEGGAAGEGGGQGDGGRGSPHGEQRECGVEAQGQGADGIHALPGGEDDGGEEGHPHRQAGEAAQQAG